MTQAKIFHNPTCSKSRQTLAFLKERGVEVDVVEYLKRAPTPEELDAICRWLGMEPQELVRAKEKRFAELGISLADTRLREEWLEVLHANPILLERPIVVVGDKAALGRPPENVLTIL